MLVCIACKKPLKEIPLYNEDKNEESPPSLPFCNNEKCKRFGLLTVAFKNEETDKEDINKGVQS